MKLTFLDRSSIGYDIDVSLFEKYGSMTVYDFTSPEEVRERVSESDIVITNKALMNASTLEGSTVRLICVTATGTDNVDLAYCLKAGIAVCNVKGYSTASVVQHTFALLFTLWERMPEFTSHTRNLKYVEDRTYSHYSYIFREMSGKNFGIIGLGAIGKEVAKVAQTLGFNVFYWSSAGKNRSRLYTRSSLKELLETCDVISINSPLTDKTKGLLGKNEFALMKPGALIINTGRGAIIVEEELADAIDKGVIGGAALDVLFKEPMASDSPYIRVLDRPNFILTPHVAWAAVEARQRCLDEICLNIDSWLEGGSRNRA